jgi:creatinine amidohydrolase
MKKNPYILAQSTWLEIKDQPYDLAILPWGATEPHNYHLPFSTDVIQAESIALKSAGLAWEKGAKVIVLPTVPWGVNTGQLDLKFCLNILPSTQLILLNDLVENLKRHAIKKLVIINSHGGNNFIPIIRELSVKHSDIFICTIDWWKVCNAEAYFTEPGDHAGEMETSVMMHFAPEFVMPLDTAADGKAKVFKAKGFKERWAWAQRSWTAISESTGVGNPRFANSENGERFVEDTSLKIAEFLLDLTLSDTSTMYE